MIARALIEALLRLLNTHETLRFLAANRKNKKQDVSDVELANEDTKGAKKGKINAQLSELIEAEKSIWDEGEVPAKELQKGITTGTLNKLVLSISAESAYDNKLLKTFITTYRSFAAPYKLFQKLIERYNVPQGRAVDAKKIQTKVTIILKYAPSLTRLIACPSSQARMHKCRHTRTQTYTVSHDLRLHHPHQFVTHLAPSPRYWVENQFFDFDDSLVQSVFDFIENVLPKDGWGDIANILKKILKAQMEARNETLSAVPPTDLTIPESKMSPTELFMALNEEEIARQLTLIEFSIYKQIEVRPRTGPVRWVFVWIVLSLVRLCQSSVCVCVSEEPFFSSPSRTALGAAEPVVEQGQAEVPRAQRDRVALAPQPPLLLGAVRHPVAGAHEGALQGLQEVCRDRRAPAEDEQLPHPDGHRRRPQHELHQPPQAHPQRRRPARAERTPLARSVGGLCRRMCCVTHSLTPFRSNSRSW